MNILSIVLFSSVVTHCTIHQVNVEYLSKKINQLDLQHLIALKVLAYSVVCSVCTVVSDVCPTVDHCIL